MCCGILSTTILCIPTPSPSPPSPISPLPHPTPYRTVLLLVQRDVTLQVTLERHVAQLSQANLNFMGQILPRKAIEAVAGLGGGSVAGSQAAGARGSTTPAGGDLAQLSRVHSGVSVVAIKILGGWVGSRISGSDLWAACLGGIAGWMF